MIRRDPPIHAGHLDLLPFVRRVFRHRMTNARLQTVETELLGMERHHDVGGWEIPGRYLDFLRYGLADPLIEVVRHNREDVRSLARLLAHVDAGFGDAVARREAHRGDLAGLARAFSRERRLDEALDCLETATALAPAVASGGAVADGRGTVRGDDADELWWAPGQPADFGGPPRRPADAPPPLHLASPWTEERIQIERARVLRRLGRFAEAAAAWEALGAGIGPFAPLAWIEVAKLREHRLGDVAGAIAAVDRAAGVIQRRRALGRLPEPRIETHLALRRSRLTGRVAAAGRRGEPAERTAAALRMATAPGQPAA
jgi:tetratricopeptide (TPR) repeat protein